VIQGFNQRVELAGVRLVTGKPQQIIAMHQQQAIGGLRPPAERLWTGTDAAGRCQSNAASDAVVSASIHTVTASFAFPFS
jgi:hypothetical protein